MQLLRFRPSYPAAALLALTLACGSEQHAEHPEADHGGDEDLAMAAEGPQLAETLVAEGEGAWRTGSLGADGRPFNRVAFRFDSEWTPVVSVRVSEDGGKTFGAWQAAELTWQEEVAHNGHADVAAPNATHVQLRFETPNASDIGFLAVNLFVVSEEPQGEALEGDDATGLDTQQQGLAADGMGLVTRAQWGARGTKCSSKHTPWRMTVHHTVTPNADSMTPSQRMRQIQSFHMDNRKWCDIGYHFLIGQNGQIFQGRAERLLGTHVGGNNTGNAGVSFVGNYMGVLPSPAMLDAGARALKAISQSYGIPLNRDRVRGHRQYSGTSCPGDRLYAHLNTLVSQAGGATAQPPAPPAPPPCALEKHVFGDIGCSTFKHDIIWLAQEGIAAGCGGGNFCPDNHVTRGQLATFLTRALKLPPGPNAFDDDNGHPHESAINAVAAAGLTQGCAAGKFCPNDQVTRAQLAVFLARALNLPAGPNAFSDDEGSAAEPSINAIAQVEITAGCGNGKYCPAEAVKRGQLARFLRRSVEYHRANCSTPSATFTDIGCSSHQASIVWMKTAGITEGCGNGRFCPAAEVTRAQAASFLYRALALPPGPDAFTDDNGSPHEPAINALAAAGILQGCAPQSFCPDALLTRAQLAALLDRALDLPAGPNAFTDDDGHPLETSIDSLAAAGITQGCSAGKFCPGDAVTRAQAAVFLHRAFVP